MTNFNNATKSFTLHAEGTESYAWAWEGIDRASTIEDMNQVGETPEKFAQDWANTLLENSIDQINPEGEMGFTRDEIESDLRNDVKYLANAIQAWLEGEYDQDDDQDGKEDPTLYTITHPMMGDWSDPATIAEISADVAMNWRDENIKYTVDVKWDKVVIYGMDYESNSRDWREWLDLGDGEYRLEIGELYQAEEEGDDEPDPQPIGVEVAVRLVEEGCIEEGAGIYIARANGHAGNYDISKDSDDRHLYEVVWVYGIIASTQTMNQAEVFLLLTDEAELGAKFYWQVMDNNEWELTNAPYLQSWAGYMEDIRAGRTPETNYFDAHYAKMIADAEAYEAEFRAMNLGESTLAKVRRQKALVTGDRDEMFPPRTAPMRLRCLLPKPVTQTREGFFICTSSAEGRGKTPLGMIYAFGDEADFYRQNPHWEGVELPRPRWFGVVILDTNRHVEGGFQLAFGGWHDSCVHAPYIYTP